MKNIIPLLCALLLVLYFNQLSYAKVSDIILAQKKAVVTISIEDNEKVIAYGSGFIISSDGTIVTNSHVIAPWNKNKSLKLYVKSSDGVYLKPQNIIAEDTDTDVALIKVNENNLPFIKITSSQPSQGDDVVVIGTPLGFESTITNGIISGIRGKYGLLQISAPISHGSSGSPVLNSKGEAIGVATLVIANGQNLNFAIPARYITSVLNNVNKDTTNIVKSSKEQNTDALCSSYNDCFDKEKIISNDSNRTDNDVIKASELLILASKYAIKDSADYYYALAKYYTWQTDNKDRDQLCTDSLEKSVKLGRNDFDTVKWLVWRYGQSDRCSDAYKLIDSIILNNNKEEYTDIIEFYEKSSCKNTSRLFNVRLKMVSKMLENDKLDFFDIMYLTYEKGDDNYVFKDDIDNFVNKSISKYKSNYLLYELRAFNNFKDDKYSKALDDVNKAYMLAPMKDKNTLLSLRVRIYIALKQYQKALNDVNILINSETDKSIVSSRPTRADIYTKLGDYQKAKKDLIIACDSKALGACDKLAEFKVNEDRGWNWVYFATNANGYKYYYDSSKIKKSKSNSLVWIKTENSSKKYTDTFHVDIDCSNSKIAIDQSGKKKEYNLISPDSVYEPLKSICCVK